MVAVYKMAGYDEIKLAQFISPPVYDSVTGAARREAITVTGHVGPGVKLFALLMHVSKLNIWMNLLKHY